MIAESDMLKYGALGFVILALALILWVIVKPLVAELRANREGMEAALAEDRQERKELTEQFLAFMGNHATAQTAAMQQVEKGLIEVVTSLRRMNGREGEP